MPVATYDAGTRTRTFSVDIAFTDGGLGSGSWTAYGSAQGPTGFGYIWTAWFYDASGGIGPPPPTLPSGGAGSPVIAPGVDDPERRCRLIISNSGVDYWDFPTAGLSLTGTMDVSVPSRYLVEAGSGFGFNHALGYEKQEGDASLSCSIMGKSTSRSVSGSGVLTAGWVLFNTATAIGDGEGSQTITITDSPGACDAPTTSVSKSETLSISGGTWSHTSAASTSGTVAYASVLKTHSGPLDGPTIVSRAYCSLTPDMAATFHGRLNLLMEAYPYPIEYRLYDSQAWQTSSDGDFTYDVSRKSYDCYSSCYDSTDTSFQSQVDRERLSDRGEIHPSAQVTVDGVTRLIPLYIHGPQWGAIGLTHDDALDVDDGTTLTPTGDFAGAWSGQSGGSVAVVSGAIDVTGAAAKKAKRTFTDDYGQTAFAAYSRLRIRLKASAADHQITLRLGSDIAGTVPYVAPRWYIQTGTAGSYTNHLIDLGVPHNDPDYTTRGGQAYEDLGLEDLGAGTYSIDLIGLENADDGMGGYTPVDLHYIPMIDHGQYGVFGIADGDDCYKLFVSSDMSIDTAVTNANANPSSTDTFMGGWTADNLAPRTTPGSSPWPASELTTNRHPMAFLGGGGLLWDGSGPTWDITFDTGATTSSLVAQWLVQTITWGFPDTLLGFLTDDGAGGYLIGGGCVVGVSVWGRVVTSTDASSPVGKDGMSGETVTLSSMAGTVISTTTTDANGWFSLPAHASASNSVKLTAVGRTLTLSLIHFRSRVVIEAYIPPDGTLLAMACSATGRVMRAYKDGSNYLLLEFRGLPDSWETVTTALVLTGSGAMIYDRQDAAQRIWLAYEDSGGIKGRYTDDEGGTWSVATTIVSSGTHPAVAISPSGVRNYFWYDGGAIKTKIYDGLDNVLTSTTTVVASGAADSPIDAIHDGELIYLTYKSGGGAVITVVSSDGGLTFA